MASPEEGQGEIDLNQNDDGDGETQTERKGGPDPSRARQRIESTHKKDQAVITQLQTKLSELEQRERAREERQSRVLSALRVASGAEDEEDDSGNKLPDPITDREAFKDAVVREARTGVVTTEQQAAVEGQRLTDLAVVDFSRSRPWMDPQSRDYDPGKRQQVAEFCSSLIGRGPGGSLTMAQLEQAEWALFGKEMAAGFVSQDRRGQIERMRSGIAPVPASRSSSVGSADLNRMSIEDIADALGEMEPDEASEEYDKITKVIGRDKEKELIREIGRRADAAAKRR